MVLRVRAAARMPTDGIGVTGLLSGLSQITWNGPGPSGCPRKPLFT
jgi:hypothetical protein